MACKTCNLKKCGCQDSYLTTPPPCPTPSDCAEAQPCSEVFPAECVLYTGLPITCGEVDVVSTNATVSEALASITSFFCDQLATNEDILCGLDIVVPADTQLEDALPLIVTYFCDVIAALPTPVDPCSSPSVPTPNPVGFIDSILMCRAGELGTEPVQIEWFDLLSSVPDTTYDLDSVQNGADADIRLVPSVGLTDIVKLEAGTNVTLTDTGSNIRIDAAGGGSGGLTWITQTCAGACLDLITLPNHGYINVNTNPGPQGSTFILPLGATVGDVVKIICRTGLGNVTCDATQNITFGGGAGINTPGNTPTTFSAPLKFYIGESEVIQFLYVGDNTWAMDTFMTSQDTSAASGYPITFRVV